MILYKANSCDFTGIEVGDYNHPEPLPVEPPVEDAPPRMNLRSTTYHTAKEVANGLDYEDGDAMEDEDDVTTDSGDESDDRFDSSNDDDDFEDEIMGDYDAADDFIT